VERKREGEGIKINGMWAEGGGEGCQYLMHLKP